MLKVGLCTINPTVGDIEGNKRKIIQNIKQAEDKGLDIIIFPEMCLPGYPAEDLLFKKTFIEDVNKAMNEIISCCRNIVALVGFVEKKKGVLYNSIIVIKNRNRSLIYRKMILPNYGVFDEKRYFHEGIAPRFFTLSRIRIGLTICEDIWEIKGRVLKQIARFKPDVIINVSASPYHRYKFFIREKLLRDIAKIYKLPTIYVNLVGGQDELLFDGGNLVCSKQGKIVFRDFHFEETLSVIIFEKKGNNLNIISEQKSARYLKPEEEVYNALVLGTRDYVFKNRFKKVVLGVSGGIDSALAAKIAVDAIGAENVHALIMPSKFSANESMVDAVVLCKNLKIDYHIISIENIFKTFLKDLEPFFKGTDFSVAEENIQARIRGTLLMAFSNKFGWLVLSTGNKSELSMGYCTLYGDMAGGFAVIRDVPKTLVYRIVHYINKKQGMEIIPKTIIERAPSAELRENQKDEDTLPAYNMLDPILKMYIEDGKTLEQIVKKGYSKERVRFVLNSVDHNEYKRRQGPPGIKITPKAFGRDRRFPIVNGYRD